MIKKSTYYIAVLRKHEVLLASFIVLVAVVALVFIFLLPYFNKAKNIYSKQLILKKQKESLSQKAKALNEIDYKYFRETYPKINWVLPNSRDYVSLFSTFDLSQSKTGVTIQRTHFQLGVISTSSASLGPTTPDGAYILSLSIDVIGDFSQLLKFIETLTDFSGRFITIEEVQWDLGGEDAEGPFLAKLAGKAYFYPAKGEIGSIDAPLPSFDKEKEEILEKIARNSLAESEAVEFEKVKTGKKNLFQ